ncbi:MAG TPA: UvrD-helicase domain-containing protein [Acetobacteraceae bacterium]|nr:UvrD-helicase domain-containing protein [Acetobacteraceae bacterium]
MRFTADLHVHSKYSRATSRDLDLEHLAAAARVKGVDLVATGDFTHPAWRAELGEKLVPAEPGLFRLAGGIEDDVARLLPGAASAADVRFMLSVEISTIYKKGDRTRKIHHLIYAPDFATVDRISTRLARIGNIASDGRPILGLDSRDLLEIVLESGEGAYLVPAHIWTPWFAALGAQSGFDSIGECYGDLAPEIFAVETGLSSDPAMNWRLSALDRYRLVSNSDAHSPGKLGREATIFEGPLDYMAIRGALETGEGYVGTVEFFPEEGKYHLDGHRACKARLRPAETLLNGGRCPVCGGKITIGVLHRIEGLADRSEAEALPPATAGEIASLVPLPEVLGELAGTGPGSKRVAASYDRLTASLGPELAILQSAPLEEIARAHSSLLAEGIARMRRGEVIREAGYDGEYGVIRLFAPSELADREAGSFLFTVAASPAAAPPEEVRALPPAAPACDRKARDLPAVAEGLDAAQRDAVTAPAGPLLIVAGPGSGKTRTLTRRIAHLVAAGAVPASAVLAITFTRRAAGEMRERLGPLLGPLAHSVHIHTFHSLGLAILRAHPEAAGLEPGFRIAAEAEQLAIVAEAAGVASGKAASLVAMLSRAKRSGAAPDAEAAALLARYQEALAARNAVDFDDLVGRALGALEKDRGLAEAYRTRFRFIAVDEFQDLDEAQYRLLLLLAPPGSNVLAIGDPDQAIYGFRGADAAAFDRFRADHSGARAFALRRNYRSSETIVAAAARLLARPLSGVAAPLPAGERITLHRASSERAEAEFVVRTIEESLGGHSFFSIDSGRGGAASAGAAAERGIGFSDFAVLYRTGRQAAALAEAFSRAGIPYRTSSADPLGTVPGLKALLAGLEAAGDVPAALRAEAARLAAKGAEPQQQAALASLLPALLGLAERALADGVRPVDALSIARETDLWDPRADRVLLSTLHAAKGLEFAVVFIVGLEDGLLPLVDHEGAAPAEERRLFYVGVTRARERLVLSRAAERMWRGRVQRLPPSRFLDDIEEALIEHEGEAVPARRSSGRQLRLL